jgi:chemotaxis protein methyltransferase CheR
MHFSQENVHLSESEFTILRDLIHDHAGLHYDIAKRDILADKLSGRVIECGFDSFIDYYYLLKYGPGAEEEWPNVMDALSVQETYFWREMDQVRALVDVIVPQHLAKRRGERPLRIWSAACATGEEPLTIAMALNEAGWFERAPIEILASDASRAAISRARAGAYRERAFRALPATLRAKYFEAKDGAWRMSPELHARVTWANVNLSAAAEMEALPLVDVIFCRNVFIYFSSASITRTVHSFAERLLQPGYLFVGASESLLRLSTEFELQEMGDAFVYIKR